MTYTHKYIKMIRNFKKGTSLCQSYSLFESRDDDLLQKFCSNCMDTNKKKFSNFFFCIHKIMVYLNKQTLSYREIVHKFIAIIIYFNRFLKFKRPPLPTSTRKYVVFEVLFAFFCTHDSVLLKFRSEAKRNKKTSYFP